MSYVCSASPPPSRKSVLCSPALLQAIGLGLGPAATAGTSAAIKWITKDGLGAVGRLFVGGKLSR